MYKNSAKKYFYPSRVLYDNFNDLIFRSRPFIYFNININFYIFYNFKVNIRKNEKEKWLSKYNIKSISKNNIK